MGEAVAGGAVTDLVVVLQVRQESVAGDALGVDGRAVVTLPEARPRALVQEHPGEHVGEPGEVGGGEIGVVAWPSPVSTVCRLWWMSSAHCAVRP